MIDKVPSSIAGVRAAAALLLVAACVAHADQARAPRTQIVATQDGNLIVRIEPGDPTSSTNGKAAKAEWYRRAPDAFKKEVSVSLKNNIAPLDAYLLPNGALVTLDDWPYKGVGDGPTIAVYSATGELLVQRNLEQMYSAEQRQQFKQSSPSIDWRPFEVPPYLMEQRLVIRDQIGGRWIVEQTGSLSYCARGVACNER